jgi:hypothetical protein
MSAPSYFSLEGDPSNSVAPYIVALDDGSGGAGDNALTAYLVNDQENMPEPGQMPDARDLNQAAYLAWAASIMFPKLSVAIHVSGTTPSVQSLIAPNRKIVSGDIGLSRNAQGVYYVTVPTAKLPQRTMPPKAYANDAAICSASAVWASNGVYHVFLGTGATAIDCDFVLDVWGY